MKYLIIILIYFFHLKAYAATQFQNYDLQTSIGFSVSNNFPMYNVYYPYRLTRPTFIGFYTNARLLYTYDNETRFGHPVVGGGLHFMRIVDETFTDIHRTDTADYYNRQLGEMNSAFVVLNAGFKNKLTENIELYNLFNFGYTFLDNARTSEFYSCFPKNGTSTTLHRDNFLTVKNHFKIGINIIGLLHLTKRGSIGLNLFLNWHVFGYKGDSVSTVDAINKSTSTLKSGISNFLEHSYGFVYSYQI